MQSLIHSIERAGVASPWLFLLLFLAASALMIWRLEALSARGFEGTMLGTLVMPYCSGIGNLIFTFIMARRGGPGAEVMTNSLVNNVTNMTLVIGLPAMIWGLSLMPKAQAKNGDAKPRAKATNIHALNRLSVLLTLVAMLFFTGATWVTGRDRRIDFTDGLILVGLFLFWQCFHVFEVLKGNVRQNRSFGWKMPVDLALLGVGACATYVSVDWLVDWVSGIKTGFISVKYLGWLSGWLMVLPNAVLALYYGLRNEPAVVYSSQAGDSHISIPLCVGIYALFQPLTVPVFFQTGILVLTGATLVHFLFVAIWGKLPRFMGLALAAAYGFFLVRGLLP